MHLGNPILCFKTLRVPQSPLYTTVVIRRNRALEVTHELPRECREGTFNLGPSRILYLPLSRPKDHKQKFKFK